MRGQERPRTRGGEGGPAGERRLGPAPGGGTRGSHRTDACFRVIQPRAWTGTDREKGSEACGSAWPAQALCTLPLPGRPLPLPLANSSSSFRTRSEVQDFLMPMGPESLSPGSGGWRPHPHPHVHLVKDSHSSRKTRVSRPLLRGRGPGEPQRGDASCRGSSQPRFPPLGSIPGRTPCLAPAPGGPWHPCPCITLSNPRSNRRGRQFPLKSGKLRCRDIASEASITQQVHSAGGLRVAPSADSRPWRQMKVASEHLGGLLANRSAPAASPGASPRGTEHTWQLGDTWAGPCHLLQKAAGAGPGQGRGAARSGERTFSCGRPPRPGLSGLQRVTPGLEGWQQAGFQGRPGGSHVAGITGLAPGR